MSRGCTSGVKTWPQFEWIVAIRFLREGRLQTLFIVAGVALGVAVIVFLSALITGLQKNFIRRVLSAQGHIQLLLPKEVTRPLRLGVYASPGEVEAAIVQVPLQRLKSIDQWQAVAVQIRAMPEVMVVSPLAGGSALVVRGIASRAITVAGIDPALYAQNPSNNAIRFFVGLSVAFGIASVLAVVVMQKSREIGIVRAMGVSQGR